MIRFTTNKGVIDIELDHEHAPKSSANFEQYVRDGFYDGTIFHRVIKGFMIGARVAFSFMPRSKPPPWIMKPLMTRWKIVPS